MTILYYLKFSPYNQPPSGVPGAPEEGDAWMIKEEKKKKKKEEEELLFKLLHLFGEDE